MVGFCVEPDERKAYLTACFHSSPTTLRETLLNTPIQGEAMNTFGKYNMDDVEPPEKANAENALEEYQLQTVKNINKEFKELVFLKDGFLPIPNFVLTAGAPKAGKSWYVLGLAVELTSNGHTVLYLQMKTIIRD